MPHHSVGILPIICVNELVIFLSSAWRLSELSSAPQLPPPATPHTHTSNTPLTQTTTTTWRLGDLVTWWLGDFLAWTVRFSQTKIYGSLLNIRPIFFSCGIKQRTCYIWIGIWWVLWRAVTKQTNQHIVLSRVWQPARAYACRNPLDEFKREIGLIVSFFRKSLTCVMFCATFVTRVGNDLAFSCHRAQLYCRCSRRLSGSYYSFSSIALGRKFKLNLKTI